MAVSVMALRNTAAAVAGAQAQQAITEAQRVVEWVVMAFLIVSQDRLYITREEVAALLGTVEQAVLGEPEEAAMAEITIKMDETALLTLAGAVVAVGSTNQVP